jgi:hypothetical protein
MDSIKALLWIYRTSLARSGELFATNWPVIFAPLAYSLLVSVASLFFSPLGIVGGMLFSVVLSACASSGLYLLENIIRIGRTTVNDFVKGFVIYLGDVLTIAFILWIPMLLLSEVAHSSPGGLFFLLAVRIILYVLLNAVPELIYQSRVSGLALLSASYEFIVANWIEWFVPNLLITGAGYLLLVWLERIAVNLPFFLERFFVACGFGLFLTFLMIYRGVLFSELSSTTRRSRVFRYRSRSG